MIPAFTQSSFHRPGGYDFAAWTLLLRPRRYNQVPRWLGRAVQALFYSELDRISPDIAKYIHDMSRLKPFTVSNILGARDNGDLLELSPNHPVTLRFSTLHPHMTAVVRNGILPTLRQLSLYLHNQPLRVVGFHREDHRAGFTNVEDLLENASDARVITMRFISPTSFKRTGQIRVAYPYPDLVFGSLFQKWRDVTPYHLPAELNVTIKDEIHLETADIQTTELRFAKGRKGIVPCFTGTATYVIQESEPELRRYIHALGEFAKYSGVGVQTTVGLGQTEISNHL